MFAETLAGTWEGHYMCDLKQFSIQVTLALKNGDPNALSGKLTFLNNTVKGVEMVSVVMSNAGNVQFTPIKWDTQPGDGVQFLGLTGQFDSVADQIVGLTTMQNCGTFSLSRGEGQYVCVHGIERIMKISCNNIVLTYASVKLVILNKPH